MDIQKAWGYYNLAKVVLKRAEEKQQAPEWDQNKTAYRPPEWNGLPTELSQLVLVKTNIAGFFFDAVIREDHTSSLKITSHPVQDGANITDHSIVEPKVLVMEILMSDAVDDMYNQQFISYVAPGNAAADKSKSKSAYHVLLEIQEGRIPVSVLTRLTQYDNMLIETISVPDDSKALYGLRCTVTLKEIFIVNVAKTKVSARPHDTDFTDRGQLQAEAIEDPGTYGYQIEKSLSNGSN
ncbi:phage baseplate protein [Sporomusa sp. KB1]|jgi:hypothetical protein|uniref:phage baseplate protein n=1 Tax=Sporomusa sp. KB1 TaxID=943346 RepID=UPI0011AB19E5|nr:hypothetical protein [Sporomusa sp. KB1]TWH46328.1 hypothetical protein Salpa_2309 [Sporomusa sp. KB1]